MSRFAPTWALTAAAMDGTDDPHLAAGAHLRVMPARVLGLPVAPLLVEKQVRDLPEEMSDDVLWTDARGDLISPAFDLSAAVRPRPGCPPSRAIR